MDERRAFFRRAGLTVRRFLHRLRRRFPKSIFPDLTGGCGIGAVVLVRILRRAGLRPELILGTFERNPHAWVEVDGEIVDVTATQFGKLPAVLIEEKDDDRYNALWSGREARRALRRWGKIDGVQRWQCPDLHEEEIRAALARLFG